MLSGRTLNCNDVGEELNCNAVGEDVELQCCWEEVEVLNMHFYLMWRKLHPSHSFPSSTTHVGFATCLATKEHCLLPVECKEESWKKEYVRGDERK